tara:strand:- start:2155 stop:2367 length:213 start_codon:yes stop_codon:yes gene_type:complete
MEVVFILVLMSSGVAMWASTMGRKPVVFFMVSLVFSPVVGLIALLIAGKTLEQKAQDQVDMERLMADRKL